MTSGGGGDFKLAKVISERNLEPIGEEGTRGEESQMSAVTHEMLKQQYRLIQEMADN